MKKILVSFFALMIFLIPDFSDAATTASLVPSVTNCTAPCAVHFDASGTIESTLSTEDTFRTLRYDFDFDDPASGTWQYSGLSKNTEAGGPLAAHVYDTPGTYIPSLNVGDDATQVTITVVDPDITWSGTNTVCLSMDTDMTGCPGGAQQLINRSSWSTIEDNKRYLLKAGQDFSSLGDFSTGQLHDSRVSSFGSGAKPIVATMYLQQSLGGYTGTWISNVSVIGLDAAGIYHSISGNDVLIYQNHIYGTGSRIDIGGALQWYGDNGTYSSSLTMPENMFIIENVSDAVDGAYTGQGQMIWMGNIQNNTLEWNMRLWQAYKAIVAHNYLVGNSSLGGKSNLKIHSAGIDAVNPGSIIPVGHGPRTAYLVVAHNIFNSVTSDGIYTTVGIEPQNNASAEGIENVIVENNTHIAGTWPCCFSAGSFGGRNITQRDATKVGDTSNAGTGHNMDVLPSSWDGPYYIDDEPPTPPSSISAPTPAPTPDPTNPLYRFWSDTFQGHFYTSSQAEKEHLEANDPNWSYEGEAYGTVDASDTNAKPVYRFWSENYKHHFYTVSEAEKTHLEANDPNWSYEGIAYYAYSTQQTGSSPVHRFWSETKKGHFYTASESEKESIIENDASWSYEGIAWYGL